MTPQEDFAAKMAKIQAEADRKMKEAREVMDILTKLQAANLPVPKMVHVYPLHGRAGSIRYEAKTPVEVLKLMPAFNPLPAFLNRSKSGTSIKMAPSDWDGYTFTWFLEVDQHSCEMSCFIAVDDLFLEVNIGVPLHFVGQYVKDNPHARTRYKLLFESKHPHRMSSIVRYQALDMYGEGSANRFVLDVGTQANAAKVFGIDMNSSEFTGTEVCTKGEQE